MAIKAVPTINERLDKIQTALTGNLKIGNECKLFLDKYSNLTRLKLAKNKKEYVFIGEQGHALERARAMIKKISDQDLESMEAEFQSIQGQISVLDSSEKEQFTAKMETIANQVEKCKSNVSTFKNETIKHIQNQTAELLVDDQGCLFGTPVGLNYDGVINECHCSELMNRSNRSGFSFELARSIEQKWPDKKEITIASIGAGGCFHELEIHTILAQRGYKVNWVLVDPNLYPETAARFKMMAQWITPGINVLSINEKDSTYFNGLAKQDPNLPLPDVFLFIDVDVFLRRENIVNFQSQVKHPCLFGDFNKYRAATDFWGDIVNIDEVN